ncbi:MAG: Nif3-like dinuclear metal center hexameric protein [Clostridia bacterium]
MKSDKIIEFMEKVAPIDAAMEYDNVGLLVGRLDREVSKILTALDCTMEVVREAVEMGAEMIICHHPVLFSGTKSITDETYEGEMLLYAIENNISIYAAHTNLDFAQGGLNDYFLEKLGYSPVGTIAENEGRIFECNTTGRRLCEKIKETFNIDMLRVNMDLDKEILVCALCTGSGKSLAKDASDKADVYITGELGHHDILNLSNYGCGYIEISHYDSEKIVMELLKKLLTVEFNGLEVYESKENKNPLTII